MTLPSDQSDRIHAGERPLKVWREHRGLEVTDLRRTTKISVGRLEQLEAGKGKKMDPAEERLLARALEIDRACLRPMNFASCSALDGDEDRFWPAIRMPKSTKLSTCRRKARFRSDAEARQLGDVQVPRQSAYRCNQCRQWHLTTAPRFRCALGIKP